jgi:hypothetical protein
MGYYEENVLYKDSFSKAICSIERLEKPERGETHSIPLSPFGMFEMAKRYDIIKGRLANELFHALGPDDGKKFKRFKQKIQLLRERIKFELADEEDN